MLNSQPLSHAFGGTTEDGAMPILRIKQLLIVTWPKAIGGYNTALMCLCLLFTPNQNLTAEAMSLTSLCSLFGERAFASSTRANRVHVSLWFPATPRLTRLRW